MIGERTKALLSAAAAIYAGVIGNDSFDTYDTTPDKARGVCVNAAYALLDAIEAREKENYRTREAK